MRQGFRVFLTVLAAALLGLPFMSHAATQEFGPYTINPGPYTTPAVLVNASLQNSRARWCPTGFDDSMQVLHALFQECHVTGEPCQDWQGSTVTGGPHVNRSGEVMTCYGGIGVPRVKGQPIRVRLVGTLTSPTPITLTILFTSN